MDCIAWRELPVTLETLAILKKNPVPSSDLEVLKETLVSLILLPVSCFKEVEHNKTKQNELLAT